MKAQYVTEDGNVFDSRIDAIRHENGIDFGLTIEQIDYAMSKMAEHRVFAPGKFEELRTRTIKTLREVGLLKNTKGDKTDGKVD